MAPLVIIINCRHHSEAHRQIGSLTERNLPPPPHLHGHWPRNGQHQGRRRAPGRGVVGRRIGAPQQRHRAPTGAIGFGDRRRHLPNGSSDPLCFSSARLDSARPGSARFGSARLGSARLGSARLGSARLGSARLGSTRLGPAQLGSVRLGSARLGSARLGSARLGSARLGSARLGSARPGSARLGSVRSGSARLGSARLGSARLGSGSLPGLYEGLLWFGLT